MKIDITCIGDAKTRILNTITNIVEESCLNTTAKICIPVEWETQGIEDSILNRTWERFAFTGEISVYPCYFVSSEVK